MSRRNFAYPEALSPTFTLFLELLRPNFVFSYMKHAIIVGYGPGVGLALGAQLISRGTKVTAISRTRPDTIADEILWISADVGRGVEIHLAIEQAVAKHGVPDAVFFNPVAVRNARGMDVDPDDIMDDLRTTVAGALHVTQCVVPYLKTVPGSSLIFTGGILSDIPHPMFTSVGIAKAALKNVVYSLSKELRATGINVQLITVVGFIKPNSAITAELVASRLIEAANTKSADVEARIPADH